MDNEMDSQWTMQTALGSDGALGGANLRTWKFPATNRTTDFGTENTTMTMTLEIKPATAFNVTLQPRPMKLKNSAGMSVSTPASRECRKGLPNPASRRDYLRALRAAEMAAWEAADRPVARVREAAQPRRLTDELSQVLVRRDKWEVTLFALITTSAMVGLLANLGALSRFANGWSQFAGMVERILS